MAGMTTLEMRRLMERYIGSSGGYLGTFGEHPELTRFYIDCDLDIDPTVYNATNKNRFKIILETAAPEAQAKIIRGILKRHPVGTSETRTQDVHDDFLRIAERIEQTLGVENPSLAITSAIVERTLADVETLIRSSNGATSGTDRIHTALHGYMRAVCNKGAIAFTKETTIGGLFKLIRENHPAFRDLGPRPQDVTQICRSLAAVMDVLNPIRNFSTPAHPNDDLLDAPEAMLVINATRTILHYIDAKLK
jgi:hypothetical protein